MIMSDKNFINHTLCPFCQSAAIQPVLGVRDHTVSKELFEVWHCDGCANRFTQLVPDAASIGPYYQSAAYISHSDTNKGLINRLYHLVRNYTLHSKRKLIQRVTGKEKGLLLDVGAGIGAFTDAMREAGWEVTALEPDETARQRAKTKYGLELQPPETLYTLPDARYDAISLWHVLEHVHDLHGYLQTFSRILKPGGKLIIAVPNYTSYDATVYQQYWAAYDVPRHLYHFSPAGMELLGQQKGFRLETTLPMWFDSLYVSMLSEQYKNGKSNLPGALRTGIWSNVKALSNAKKCSSVIYVFSKTGSV